MRNFEKPDFLQLWETYFIVKEKCGYMKDA